MNKHNAIRFQLNINAVSGRCFRDSDVMIWNAEPAKITTIPQDRATESEKIDEKMRGNNLRWNVHVLTGRVLLSLPRPPEQIEADLHYFIYQKRKIW